MFSAGFLAFCRTKNQSISIYLLFTKALMAEKKNNIVDSEDLLLVWKFISRNFLILVLIPLLAGGLAYLYTHRMPEVYKAKTEILLHPGTNYDYRSQIYQGLTGYSEGYNQITNQIRVLQSHDIINKTLEKLDFEVSYFIVGRVKTTELPYIDAIDVDVRLLNPRLYGVPFNIRIINQKEYRVTVELDGDTYSINGVFGKRIRDDNFWLTISKNELLNPESFSTLQSNNYQFIVNSQSHLIQQYKEALEIRNEEKTSILEISIISGIPSRAKVFLDTLSAVYVDYTIESQIELNENTLDYINDQLNGIRLIMDSIETDLQNFKASKDILNITREQEEFFNKLMTFESEQRQINLELQALSALEQYLMSPQDEKVLPPSLYIISDAFLQSSLQELYNLEVQRNQSFYDIKDPSMGAQRSEKSIQALRADILVYIANLRKAMKNRSEDIKGEINFYENALRNLPRSEREMLNIERSLTVNENMYTYLLEKKANTIIARAAIIPEISIIEVARNLGVVGPDKLRITYFFLAGGFILALLIAFIRSIFFDKIRNTADLKRITALPLLGAIPTATREDETLVVTSDPYSGVTESFRSIRTNLQYFNNTRQSKTILLTSLHPGEGKTFCSVNLAAILAKAQKRTVLLDMDMHKPKVHKMLNTDNSSGLSSYIAGRASLSEILKSSDIENLDFITAGEIPPNASELVLNNRVEELIDLLREKYDYIIVDTPPLMLISDALVLMRLVDVSLFVLNTNKATKNGVRHIEDIVTTNSLTNIALLLNNIKARRWKYYYNKYGYRYGYGYGYGYNV